MAVPENVDPRIWTSLLAVLVSSLVTMIGWRVASAQAWRRESEARRSADARIDRTRRLELSLRQSESQISEFYGPIYGKIQFIWATWEVKERIRSEIDDADRMKVEHYILDKYFVPIHAEIRQLLMSRIHLIEGNDVPRSFYDYIQHSVMENIQVKLWDEKAIDTSKAKGIPWSPDFADDIQEGLRAAMKRYDDAVLEMREVSARPAGDAVHARSFVWPWSAARRAAG